MEELYRHGVQTVCIAPGSRSAPLTWAAADHPELETIVHIDERGLGFHALGIAKASNTPVAIVCTSGSAVANLLPAVVEASMSRVPLIVLTADRPPELIACGANQAIEQPGIFSHYVRWETNLLCPAIEQSPVELLSTLGEAILKSTAINSGPVHINCPFREPLSPQSDGCDLESYLTPLQSWREESTPLARAILPCDTPPDDLDALDQTAQHTRGLLIIGQLQTPHERVHAHALATALGWPVMADIATPFRLGVELDHLVAYADQLLLTKHRAVFEAAECIIHIGGALVSKRIQTFIEAQAPKPYLRITPGPLRMDPGHCSTAHIVMASLDSVDWDTLEPGSDTQWRDALIEGSDTLGCFLAGQFSGMTLSEPEVIRSITQTETSDVFLGNSMPIRDADCYGAPEGYITRVHANRGASGIDGNIATAAGIAHAQGRVTAILGDLATLHDLNSLALLQKSTVVLVIINNAGGGIFSFLPIADHTPHVEEFFNTPHDCTFASAATLYGLKYAQPQSLMAFQQVYDEALTRETSSIIEVITDRDENVALHRRLERDLVQYMNEIPSL